MSDTLKRVISILVIGLITCSSYFATRHLFAQTGIPVTEDGEAHLARIASYDHALKSGQFPPRWAAFINFGYGSPVLNYNYPLPYLFSIPLLSSFSIVDSWKAIMFLSYFFGGLGMFVYTSKHSTLSGLATAIVYQLAPYWSVNIYSRGSFGEMLAFGIIPWVFFTLDKSLTSKNSLWRIASITTTALFFISHNVSVFLGSGLIVLYGLMFHRNKSHFWFTQLIIAFLLSLWFWLPALTELPYTVLVQDNRYNNFLELLKPLSQILFQKPSFNYVDLSIGEPAHKEVGYAFLLLIPIFLYAFIFRKLKENKKVWFWFFCFFTAIFMISEYSISVWKILPIYRFILHPFRLLFFTTFAGSLAIGHIVKKWPWLSMFFISLAVLNQMLVYEPRGYTPYQDDYLYQYPLLADGGGEFLPAWFKVESLANNGFDEDVYVRSTDKDAQIEIITNTGFQKKYFVMTSTPTTIIERTAYFPGWETKVNGQKVNISVNRNLYQGMINYELEPGKYEITTRFTQNTLPRIIGNSVSVITFCSLILYSIYHSKSVHKTIL